MQLKQIFLNLFCGLLLSTLLISSAYSMIPQQTNELATRVVSSFGQGTSISPFGSSHNRIEERWAFITVDLGALEAYFLESPATFLLSLDSEFHTQSGHFFLDQPPFNVRNLIRPNLGPVNPLVQAAYSSFDQVHREIPVLQGRLGFQPRHKNFFLPSDLLSLGKRQVLLRLKKEVMNRVTYALPGTEGNETSLVYQIHPFAHQAPLEHFYEYTLQNDRTYWLQIWGSTSINDIDAIYLCQSDYNESAHLRSFLNHISEIYKLRISILPDPSTSPAQPHPVQFNGYTYVNTYAYTDPHQSYGQNQLQARIVGNQTVGNQTIDANIHIDPNTVANPYTNANVNVNGDGDVNAPANEIANASINIDTNVDSSEDWNPGLTPTPDSFLNSQIEQIILAGSQPGGLNESEREKISTDFFSATYYSLLTPNQEKAYYKALRKLLTPSSSLLVFETVSRLLGGNFGIFSKIGLFKAISKNTQNERVLKLAMDAIQPSFYSLATISQSDDRELCYSLDLNYLLGVDPKERPEELVTPGSIARRKVGAFALRYYAVDRQQKARELMNQIEKDPSFEVQMLAGESLALARIKHEHFLDKQNQLDASQIESLLKHFFFKSTPGGPIEHSLKISLPIKIGVLKGIISHSSLSESRALVQRYKNEILKEDPNILNHLPETIDTNLLNHLLDGQCRK